MFPLPSLVLSPLYFLFLPSLPFFSTSPYGSFTLPFIFPRSCLFSPRPPVKPSTLIYLLFLLPPTALLYFSFSFFPLPLSPRSPSSFVFPFPSSPLFTFTFLYPSFLPLPSPLSPQLFPPSRHSHSPPPLLLLVLLILLLLFPSCRSIASLGGQNSLPSCRASRP